MLAVAACAGTPPPAAPVAAPAAEASPLGSYLAARHAERRRDLSSAARYMTEVLRNDPDNFEIMGRTHTLLLEDGRFEEAVALASRIVAASPANAQANITLAVAEARRGDYRAVGQRLEGLPLAGANRVLLPLLRAWVEVAQDRPAAALNVLKSVGEIQGFRPLYEYQAALVSDVAGRHADAEAHYRKALETESGASVRLVEAAGNFFERQGRPDEARQIYARFSSDFPDSVLITAARHRLDQGGGPPGPVVPDARSGMAEALFNVAGALRQEGGGQLALMYGQLALALVPGKPAGLILVADILDSHGRYAESSAMFARVPPHSPLSWSARLRMAENLESMGETERAIETLRALADERPERVDALVAFGQILRIKQRFAEAALAYDRAIERLGTVQPRHWALFYARGIAHERSKQWAKAEADFLRALDLQPEQPDVLNYLGYSWVEQGTHLERAHRMLERAVELRPNSGHIIDSLGWALFKTGRYREAVPYLERAVELLPEDPVILDHLGDAYWKVGRLDEARFQWRRALRNKPEPDLRGEIERKIERGMAANSAAPPG